MIYREIYERYVICDKCHTSLSVDDATDEDADNEAADRGLTSPSVSWTTATSTRPPTAAGNVTGSKAGTTARSTGTSNAMTATSPTLAHRTSWKPRDGTSTEIIHATASVRTTAISHAANAASGMSDLCTGSNTRDGR